MLLEFGIQLVEMFRENLGNATSVTSLALESEPSLWKPPFKAEIRMSHLDNTTTLSFRRTPLLIRDTREAPSNSDYRVSRPADTADRLHKVPSSWGTSAECHRKLSYSGGNGLPHREISCLVKEGKLFSRFGESLDSGIFRRLSN
jgi:hypothetical protein